MDSNRWLKIEEVFNATLALPPNERERFLDSACAQEPDVRAEVRSLLQEAEQEDDFLSQPAFTLGARLLTSESYEFVRSNIREIRLSLSGDALTPSSQQYQCP